MSWVKAMFEKLFPRLRDEHEFNAAIEEASRENEAAVHSLKEAYQERKDVTQNVKKEVLAARVRANIVAFEAAVKQEGRKNYD